MPALDDRDVHYLGKEREGLIASLKLVLELDFLLQDIFDETGSVSGIRPAFSTKSQEPDDEDS